MMMSKVSLLYIRTYSLFRQDKHTIGKRETDEGEWELDGLLDYCA